MGKGVKLIDLGCMQINHYYHGDKFVSVRAMFDPARNVEYAARFLKELKQREGSWTMAVARYNAGPNNQPAQKRYVCIMVGISFPAASARGPKGALVLSAETQWGHASGAPVSPAQARASNETQLRKEPNP